MSSVDTRLWKCEMGWGGVGQAVPACGGSGKGPTERCARPETCAPKFISEQTQKKQMAPMGTGDRSFVHDPR